MRFLFLALISTGCIRSTVNNLTTQKVIPTAALVGDVDRVCRTGGALGYALDGLTSKSPHQAMVIADTTAALCDEAAANALALEAARAPQVATDPVAAVRDLKEQERRLRARAAGRFQAGWSHGNVAFGTLGETCPKVKSKEELTFLVTLMAGTLAMLHDKASGSTHEVPLDTLNRVGRAAPCVTGWWEVPVSLQAAAWAIVPGSGPAEIDPWDQMLKAAEASDDQGMRLGWALLAVVADNAGRDDLVARAIEGAATSVASTPSDPEFALFDRYALDLLQFQADRRWIAERGHRVQGLSLPEPEAEPVPAAEDPFAEDPFGDPPAEETP